MTCTKIISGKCACAELRNFLRDNPMNEVSRAIYDAKMGFIGSDYSCSMDPNERVGVIIILDDLLRSVQGLKDALTLPSETHS